MKLLKHSRDEVGDFQNRVLLHIPIGYIIGLLSVVPFSGSTLAGMFLKYERNEDLHTEDQAWKDIFGGMVGFVPGAFTGLGLLIWFILWLIGR